MLYIILFGLSPSLAVTVSIIAGINPKITENVVDTKTIFNVSINALTIISFII